MFDQDDPGRAAVSECIDLFSPGKCKVAKLPLKDASDMLQAGRGSEIINAIWGAKELRPDGIINGKELWDELHATKQFEALPMPYKGLESMIEGHRIGEVLMLTAGSGVGKSEVARQIYYHWNMNHGETLGLIHLEELVVRTALGLQGLWLKKRLNRKRGLASLTPEEDKASFDATVGNGRVHLYRHFGSTDQDNLIAKIRYFVKGLGCRTVVLDHVSMVISGVEDGDERRMLDNLMTKLSTLAQELQCRILTICHLKRKEGVSYNEGATICLSDLRGSAAIEQLSHTVIALERDQQNAKKKHWTRVRVLKCRETGETGVACWLRYDPETGWLNEEKPSFDEDEEKSPF
jgi:twinkle protein